MYHTVGLWKVILVPPDVPAVRSYSTNTNGVVDHEDIVSNEGSTGALAPVIHLANGLYGPDTCDL